VILDSERFLQRERPTWESLARRLDALDAGVSGARSPDALLELHHLFRRTASGLARLRASAADPGLLAELDALVARAYAEVHSGRAHRPWRALWQWVSCGFPQAFRRHLQSFAAVLWVTLAGAVVGAVLIAADRDNRQLILPFSHLHGSPSERVAKEEARQRDGGGEAAFAAYLMQNNIQVTINAFALGVIFGIGTVVVLFYNGVILGAVVFDYVADGQSVFLMGWLLPHGSVELPAIFLGGQAGFVLARAVLGRGRRAGLRVRLREVGADAVSLVGGAAILLVWAGLVEAWFSQNHEPVLPYSLKILVGVVHLAALTAWLGWGGRRAEKAAEIGGAPADAGIAGAMEEGRRV